MKLTAVCLSSFLLLVALPCVAQSQDAASGSSGSAKPASSPANAQTNASMDKTNTSAEKTQTSMDTKKPKKIWTNDEIGSVKGTISVVGDDHPSSGSRGNYERATSDGPDDARQTQIENYRDQVHDLQAQIDATDKRIAQLKNFKAEDSSPSGGIKPYQGYDMVPLEEQVKQLEEKKKQLQAKLDDVESEARKNGIDPGDLR
jgi:chromosome segregation ATPase